MQQIFLGFASGVMIAASIWSLILPAFDNAGKTPAGAAVVSLGFLLGCLGMLLLDKLVPHQHMDEASPEGRPSHMSRPKLLVLAVAVIGGVAGWYFKIYRPKKQQATDAAEDYGDDYDDTPPWEDEDETESEGEE